MPKLIRNYAPELDLSHLTEEDRATLWIIFGDVGQSSKVIWAVMKKVPFLSMNNYPRDVSDLTRCMALLEAVPEWKARISEMAQVSPVWQELSEHWDELTVLFMQEGGLSKTPKSLPKTYELLDILLRRGLRYVEL